MLCLFLGSKGMGTRAPVSWEGTWSSQRASPEAKASLKPDAGVGTPLGQKLQLY